MRRRMRKVSDRTVEVLGMPDSEESLRHLKPFEFQNWVVQKFTGTHSPRKSGGRRHPSDPQSARASKY